MLESIKKLREITGLPISDIKSALEKSNGDEDRALEILRTESQLSKKRDVKEAKDGIIESYIHHNKKVGAMIELNCETDFVAKNPEFQELARDLAMQVASMNPEYISFEDIDPENLKDIKKKFSKEISDKPKYVIDKIVEGKIKKYCSEVCLMDQLFIKDQKITVRELIERFMAKFGENIIIKKFVRFKL